MAVRTYLGAEATDAIEAACVEFSHSELRTITDYSYGGEVAAELEANGYVMCVTWRWDSSNDCTGTAYGRGNPKVAAGDPLTLRLCREQKGMRCPERFANGYRLDADSRVG